MKVKWTYQGKLKLVSVMKTIGITVLLMLLTASMVWVYFVQKEANRNLFLYVEAKEDINEIEKDLNGMEEKYLGLVENYVKIVSISEEKPADRDWEYMKCSAYTSLDEGVNDVSAIGMNIGKWSSYMNFVAVNLDNIYGIEYGDTLLIEMPDKVIRASTVVDTGGDLEIDQVDLYFGVDIEAAFEFGKRSLKVWIIKS